MNKLRRKISASNLTTLVLVLTILVVGFFIWTYISKTSPANIVASKVGNTITPKPPKFLFAFGDENGMLLEPYGVAVSEKGEIYVADTGHQTIKVFDINGKFLFQFGSKGKGPGQFLGPCGIAISNNEVYVADGLNMTLQVFDLAGNYIRDLITGDLKKNIGAIRPMGLCTDEQNNIYLTDIFNHRVIKFNNSGQFELQIGKPGNKPGEFRYPNDVAVDKEGYIYVSDSNNSRIQIFDPTGKVLSPETSAMGFSITKGMAIDGNGLLYVAEPAQGKIYVIKADKEKPEPLFTIEGSGDSYPLSLPTGVSLYENKVIVTDTGHNRILVYGY